LIPLYTFPNQVEHGSFAENLKRIFPGWQLARVFQNLIGNAIKFRGKESPMISVQAESSGALCTFTVSDNGIGVPPEYAEKVFVVFHRLHSRTEHAGNGIGLALCRKIIEHYGGKIWLEAPTGGGSAFKFTLPCEKPN
jgi:light-regulated signal transduction histidine kinase (bacteriophytochrome)